MRGRACPPASLPPSSISDADSYFDDAAAQGIRLRRADRRNLIAAAVQDVAARAAAIETGGADPLPPGIIRMGAG